MTIEKAMKVLGRKGKYRSQKGLRYPQVWSIIPRS
jgi:hypothetical protein